MIMKSAPKPPPLALSRRVFSLPRLKSFAIMELACPAEPEEAQDQVDLAGQHGQARMRDAGRPGPRPRRPLPRRRRAGRTRRSSPAASGRARPDAPGAGTPG